jgi:pimeloyl-ACP methyl ester carboxylesterase
LQSPAGKPCMLAGDVAPEKKGITSRDRGTIFCISGLGADEKAFSKLTVAGYQLYIIQWLQPLKNETIEAYATRMRQPIIEENPILMGLSFGGMICTEIAKQITVKKIILISSIKSLHEMPLWMRAVAKLNLNKVVPLKRTSKFAEAIQNLFLGITTPEEKAVVAISRRKDNKAYIQWAVNQVINWKNDWQHPSTFHIHGDADRMFPIKRVKATYIIKNAGHFMIMNRASEVSSCINLIIHNVP